MRGIHVSGIRGDNGGNFERGWKRLRDCSHSDNGSVARGIRGYSGARGPLCSTAHWVYHDHADEGCAKASGCQK